MGDYTFAPYKAVWPWIATSTRGSVAAQSNGQVVIPEHNTSFVAFADETEAHYFCSLLNSAPADMVTRARTLGGEGGLASPSIPQHLCIPEFDSSNPLHQSLGSLSQQAHQLAAQDKERETQLQQVQEESDLTAAELWGLSEEELEEIRRSLGVCLTNMCCSFKRDKRRPSASFNN